MTSGGETARFVRRIHDKCGSLPVLPENSLLDPSQVQNARVVIIFTFGDGQRHAIQSSGAYGLEGGEPVASLCR